jgi:restriction system protein
MIPDYQALMRPVLECAASGEARIGEVVEALASKLGLSSEERDALLPSGKQARFANRVNWAKSYLKQGGLIEITGRGRFKITDRGLEALQTQAVINNAYLAQFAEFQSFRTKGTELDAPAVVAADPPESGRTPDEELRRAHEAITRALASELLGSCSKCDAKVFRDFARRVADRYGLRRYVGRCRPGNWPKRRRRR